MMLRKSQLQRVPGPLKTLNDNGQMLILIFSAMSRSLYLDIHAPVNNLYLG